MTADADASRRAAEAEQKQVFDRLRGLARDRATALVILEKAQSAWEGYRDAGARLVAWPRGDGQGGADARAYTRTPIDAEAVWKATCADRNGPSSAPDPRLNLPRLDRGPGT